MSACLSAIAERTFHAASLCITGEILPDKPQLHPGKTLCYHFKKDHDELGRLVEAG